MRPSTVGILPGEGYAGDLWRNREETPRQSTQLGSVI